MLILLFGVSGVGKSTIINELTGKFGWRYITTYMTRPLRDGEVDKTSIGRDQFREMDAAGRFVTVNNLFGNSYGTPVVEVEDAVNDLYLRSILDFPISKRHLLGNYPHTSVVVLPESIHYLIDQIKRSGREERLAEILDDYDQHYARYQGELVHEDGTIVIVNYHGRETEVATRIFRRIETEI